MTIKELRTKKLTTRELLICQYAKEIIITASDSIKQALKENNGKAMGNALRDLESEARLIATEKELKNCLWLEQMLNA